PMLTQVRLLRVLESGEFIKVGSSKVLKTDVRVVTATNVNIPEAIRNGKFREDLYYRLNTVPIHVPPLRERKEDIHLLFRKFASDFAERYKMPTVVLQPEAMKILTDYRWPGNVRQLKNVTEQLSILERQKNISAEVLMKYIPQETMSHLPVLVKEELKGGEFSEREILYKVLFDMKKDIVDMKKLVLDLIASGGNAGSFAENNAHIIDKLYHEINPGLSVSPSSISIQPASAVSKMHPHEELSEELLSLAEKEKEIIKRAVEKHRGKRKYAAKELGISERTLYRKIKEYDIK
ncbi:MAG TPA: sigma 54-interacting transcriptional regulator, partial [Bacteroidia bacterium]|nr:sigma 54-interacting transcriptional regulator [Bacteroidia bacterium]